MSAFGGKADISGRHQMSAFDPKRTLSFIALTRVRHFGGRLARGQGERDVGRRDAAVVSVDGGGSVVRGGRYPLYPRKQTLKLTRTMSALCQLRCATF